MTDPTCVLPLDPDQESGWDAPLILIEPPGTSIMQLNQWVTSTERVEPEGNESWDSLPES